MPFAELVGPYGLAVRHSEKRLFSVVGFRLSECTGLFAEQINS